MFNSRGGTQKLIPACVKLLKSTVQSAAGVAVKQKLQLDKEKYLPPAPSPGYEGLTWYGLMSLAHANECFCFCVRDFEERLVCGMWVCLLPGSCGGVVLKANRGKIILRNTLDSRLDLVFKDLSPALRGVLFGTRKATKNAIQALA